MPISVLQLPAGGFDTNFCYLVHDRASGEAALVDPCGSARTIEQVVRKIGGLKPKYVLLTHGHRDHCDAWPAAKQFFPAPLAAHPRCAVKPDLALADHQRLPLGSAEIECLHAPGHSADSVLYRLGDQALFTGDTLFIDCCGYCDAASMFKTMREVIFPLPDTLEVYSGHDYGRVPHGPLGVEKTRNPYLATADFAEFREKLKDL